MSKSSSFNRVAIGKIGATYLSVAAALVLAACGGSDPVAVETPSPTPPVTTTPPEEEEEDEVAEPEPETVTVPDVVGLKLARARSELKDAGLSVSRTRKASDKPPGTVLRQNPVAGKDVPPGGTVRLVVAKEKPPPPPDDGGGNCHSSYEGACLDPNASDYDCEGGSGDGPKYTGRVDVVGPDEYGLDADGDGVGCE